MSYDFPDETHRGLAVREQLDMEYMAKHFQAAIKPRGRVYISGGMSGLPDLNRPAFNAEADRLRALGYQVENPAGVQLPEGAAWEDYMRVDIPLLLSCTHIRMLDGWTMSKGARLEHHIALQMGIEVLHDSDIGEQS